MTLTSLKSDGCFAFADRTSEISVESGDHVPARSASTGWGRGAKRRIRSREQSDGGSQQRRAQGYPEVQHGGPGPYGGHAHDDQGSEARAEDPADQAHGRSFHQELCCDVPTRGAKCAPETDLAHPLEDRDEGDVGDADGTYEKTRLRAAGRGR